jgi:hypothetical protein
MRISDDSRELTMPGKITDRILVCGDDMNRDIVMALEFSRGDLQRTSLPNRNYII